MKWYFQYTPHDVWDYDATNNLIVIDTQHEGQDVRAVVQPNRNGYVYVLDAKTGKFLQASQYVDRVNWAKGIDDNGRPIVDEKYVPMDGGNPEYICPGNVGGNNGSFTYAYSAATKLMYVPTIESCSKMEKTVTVFVNGQPFWGGGPGVMQGEDGSSYGHISAIDPPPARSSGATKIPIPSSVARSRRQVGSCSAAISLVMRWPSTTRRAKCCGNSRPALLCAANRSPTRSAAVSTLPLAVAAVA